MTPGQPYYDEPIYAMPKVSLVEASLAHVFGRKLPEPIHVGFERVRLRWLKPGPDGELVPMEQSNQ